MRIMKRGILFFSLIFVGVLRASISWGGEDTSHEIRVGHQNAPVTIIEYSSLTCAHCAHFHRTVLPILMEKYIKLGKVQLIFRHFPIDGYALKAAAIVAKTPAVRRFAMVNKFFETQGEWAGENCVEALARLSGQSVDACQKIVLDKKLEDELLSMRLKAEREMRIEGTPTFVINGRVMGYAPTLQQIEAKIKPILDASAA